MATYTQSMQRTWWPVARYYDFLWILLHERQNLECNWITPNESGSLSNITTYGLSFIMHAEFVAKCTIWSFANSHFIHFVSFWSNGSNYVGYREYAIDKLLEPLKLILFNTYIQFNGSIFKQIIGIPMGGNASPFIANLYLYWCEYCYKTKVVKADYVLTKLLSYNCRYLDDICTVNIQNFGDIAIDIYDNTLLLEGCTCSHKQDTFLDLHIRAVDHKFITGIYHKVDDFNFEVICYPFPQSNVHSMLGYPTYYSQLIRAFRMISYFGQNLAIPNC